jgi:TPR repeat protein
MALNRALSKLTAGLAITVAVAIAGPSLPPVAYALNWIGCALVETGAYSPAVSIFSFLAGSGNADGLNNLGIMHLKCWGVPCDGNKAAELFEDALKQGHHTQAAYNLAEMKGARRNPKSDDPDADYRQAKEYAKGEVLFLLRPNVAAGDVHSAVLLARKLSSLDWEKPGDEEANYRLELLEKAAATRDTDYRYMLANELVDQARSIDIWKNGFDVELREKAVLLFHKAWPHLIAVHEAGDPRAADLLSFLRRQVLDRIPEAVTPAILAYSDVGWAKLAADMGHMPARCGFAIARYRQAEKESSETAAAILLDALPYLVDCAQAKRKKRAVSPAFGKPAMYSVKLSGGQTALVNSPGWANMYLGEMYAAGRGVERDVAKARGYFLEAATQHDFAEARARLQDLPSVN